MLHFWRFQGSEQDSVKNNLSLPLRYKSKMKKNAATEPSSHSTATHSKGENTNEDILAIMTRDLLTQMTLTINDKLKFHLDCVMSIKIVTDSFLQCCICGNIIHFECTLLAAYQMYNFSNSNQKFTCINCTSGNNWILSPLQQIG